MQRQISLKQNTGNIAYTNMLGFICPNSATKSVDTYAHFTLGLGYEPITGRSRCRIIT